MRPDNSHYLHLAQRRHHEDLIERAVSTIRSLDGQGQAVTFARVVRESGVSRSFINKVPELAGEIRRLRSLHRAAPQPVPSAQRMSDRSKDARITQLKDSNARLREELARLREQNAVLLGKLRG
ncbi:MAG: hypothetical protein QOI20_996 [Acidimicrobiaceae bacterium]|nr:hypothetical protein [Acidimicrobiaceae bacterium]